MFVASTYFDLKQVRNELQHFLRELGLEPVLFETAGAVPGLPAPDSALQHAAQADICILIVGESYSSTSEASVSYTHHEYRVARDNKRPVFAFVERRALARYQLYQKRSDPSFWKQEKRALFSFLTEISGYGTRFPFETIAELKQGLRYQLASYFGYLVREYGELDSVRPRTALGWLELGNRLWDRRGRFGSALLCYRRALSIDPEHRHAIANLGRALRLTGRSQEAIPILRSGIRLYPSMSIYRRELIKCFAEVGTEDEALTEAAETAAAFPDDPLVFVAVAHQYWRCGRKREAALAAKRAYELRPGSGVVYRTYTDYRTYKNELKMDTKSDKNI